MINETKMSNLDRVMGKTGKMSWLELWPMTTNCYHRHRQHKRLERPHWPH